MTIYNFRVGLEPMGFFKQTGAQVGEFLKYMAQLLGREVTLDSEVFTSLDIPKVPASETPSHCVFLIGTDLFEYDSDGWHRLKGVGRNVKDGSGKVRKIDWDKLGGKVNGTTKVTPDDLENKIKQNGGWNKGSYNLLNHNCHHFVKWCLDNVGAGFFYKNYKHRYLS